MISNSRVEADVAPSGRPSTVAASLMAEDETANTMIDVLRNCAPGGRTTAGG